MVILSLLHKYNRKHQGQRIQVRRCSQKTETVHQCAPETKPEKGRRDSGNPIILTTDRKKDNGKGCDYCINKAWKVLNHTEPECYTKERQERKKKGKTSKTKVEEEGFNDGLSICHITVKLAVAHICERQGKFQYDTATCHHTTNIK